MEGLSVLFAVLAAIGAAQGLAGAWLTRRCSRAAVPSGGGVPVTVLKPLHGDEPLLEEALASLCAQDYPAGFQIVFGVGTDADTALPVVARVRERFPDLDIAVVIDATVHGTNPKVGNLINMVPAARHDILAIADSDVHARPDYLRHLAAALIQPGVGLVSVLYAGLPAFPDLACRLGATQITHGFLPGALLARAMGRRDCLGATMVLRRETLAAIGGFSVMADHLADDNVLGLRVRALGLDVALAGTVVATTVPERGLRALWRHEMRWARTIRALEPVGFAASVVQFALFWALLAVIAAAGAMWSLVLLGLVWVLRAFAATCIDRALRPMLGGLAFAAPVWLLPLRDLLSAAEWAVCHAGRQVDWRGTMLEADTPPRHASPVGDLNKGSNAR